MTVIAVLSMYLVNYGSICFKTLITLSTVQLTLKLT